MPFPSSVTVSWLGHLNDPNAKLFGFFWLFGFFFWQNKKLNKAKVIFSLKIHLIY